MPLILLRLNGLEEWRWHLTTTRARSGPVRSPVGGRGSGATGHGPWALGLLGSWALGLLGSWEWAFGPQQQSNFLGRCEAQLKKPKRWLTSLLTCCWHQYAADKPAAWWSPPSALERLLWLGGCWLSRHHTSLLLAYKRHPNPREERETQISLWFFPI